MNNMKEVTNQVRAKVLKEMQDNDVLAVVPWKPALLKTKDGSYHMWEALISLYIRDMILRCLTDSLPIFICLRAHLLCLFQPLQGMKIR